MKGWLPEWPNGADCKSAGFRLRWFESITTHILLKKTRRTNSSQKTRNLRASRTQKQASLDYAETQPEEPVFEKDAEVAQSIEH